MVGIRKYVVMGAAALSLVSLSLCAERASAADLGVEGETFEIVEEPFFDMLRRRLAALEADGAVERYQDEFRDRVVAGIERPRAVAGIGPALVYASRQYDPTVYAEEDYVDHLGRVIVPEGTAFNPLDHRPMDTQLVFVDGDDADELDWVEARMADGSPRSKYVLVSGAPLEVMRERGFQVFFDQHSILSDKFDIVRTPSVVRQDGRFLLIEELPIPGRSSPSSQKAESGLSGVLGGSQ